MAMPMHIFISLGNILATQFRKEKEQQEKEQADASASAPSFGNLPNVADFMNSMSNISLPSF